MQIVTTSTSAPKTLGTQGTSTIFLDARVTPRRSRIGTVNPLLWLLKPLVIATNPPAPRSIPTEPPLSTAVLLRRQRMDTDVAAAFLSSRRSVDRPSTITATFKPRCHLNVPTRKSSRSIDINHTYAPLESENCGKSVTLACLLENLVQFYIILFVVCILEER